MRIMETRRDHLSASALWLRDERRRLGLSQERFAEAIGTKKDSISNYERGMARVPRKLVPSIAQLTGKSRADIRRALGIEDDDLPDDSPAQPPSVIAAILSDPTLIPEAKEHLTRQYGLLQRLKDPEPARPGTPEYDAERAARELQQAIDGAAPDSVGTVTDRRRSPR